MTLADVVSRLTTIPGLLVLLPDQSPWQQSLTQFTQDHPQFVQLYEPLTVSSDGALQTRLLTLNLIGSGLPETRSAAESVRQALSGTPREPTPYRLLRLTPIPLEGDVWRYQFSFEWRGAH